MISGFTESNESSTADILPWKRSFKGGVGSVGGVGGLYATGP